MCDLKSSIDTWRTNNFQHKNKSRIACGSSTRWLWLTNPLWHQNMQYLHTQRQCISQCHCLSSAIQAAVAFEFIDFLHPVPGSRLRSKQICFSYANTTHSNQNTSQAAGRLSLLMLRLLVWSALRLLDLKKTSLLLSAGCGWGGWRNSEAPPKPTTTVTTYFDLASNSSIDCPTCSLIVM